MTSRECPWCGGHNLRITNVSNGIIHWEDSECAYREITNYYPYDVVISRKYPRQKKPDYITPVDIPSDQKTLFIEND